jgi:cell division protein FtsB
MNKDAMIEKLRAEVAKLVEKKTTLLDQVQNLKSSKHSIEGRSFTPGGIFSIAMFFTV